MTHGLKSSPKQRLLALIVGILTCLSASYGRSEEDSPEQPWLSQTCPAGVEDSVRDAHAEQTDRGQPDERYSSAVTLVALQGFAVGALVSLFLVLTALLLLVLANGRLAARQTVPQSQAESEVRWTTNESPVVAHDSPTATPAEPPKPARSTGVTGRPAALIQGRSEHGGVFQQILEQNIQLRRVFYADTAG